MFVPPLMIVGLDEATKWIVRGSNPILSSATPSLILRRLVRGGFLDVQMGSSSAIACSSAKYGNTRT